MADYDFKSLVENIEVDFLIALRDGKSLECENSSFTIPNLINFINDSLPDMEEKTNDYYTMIKHSITQDSINFNEINMKTKKSIQMFNFLIGISLLTLYFINYIEKNLLEVIMYIITIIYSLSTIFTLISETEFKEIAYIGHIGDIKIYKSNNQRTKINYEHFFYFFSFIGRLSLYPFYYFYFSKCSEECEDLCLKNCNFRKKELIRFYFKLFSSNESIILKLPYELYINSSGNNKMYYKPKECIIIDFET
jgi:hypothetical protein